MIPKIRSAQEVQPLDALLSTGPAREIRFCVIIETSESLERAHVYFSLQNSIPANAMQSVVFP